jgi:hypothetical protein
MASKGTEANRIASPQVFDCDSIPIPPGTKSQARLPRGLEGEPSARRVGWLLLGAAALGLLVGAVIGHFWLP